MFHSLAVHRCSRYIFSYHYCSLNYCNHVGKHNRMLFRDIDIAQKCFSLLFTRISNAGHGIEIQHSPKNVKCLAVIIAVNFAERFYVSAEHFTTKLALSTYTSLIYKIFMFTLNGVFANLNKKFNRGFNFLLCNLC